MEHVYVRRFSESEAANKDRIWREITRFLQRYVDPNGTVIDVGCDRGDFVRNIDAREKWATDLRDVSRHLPPEITFVQTDGLSLAECVPTDYFDTVFMSNYLEHLPSNDAVIDQMKTAHDLLKSGGVVIILQPNIRLVGGRYWDFIDHRVALTEKSLVEVAELTGFVPRCVIKRFLPYTTKSHLPKAPRVVRLYLRTRPAWLLFGKQSLIVAAKP